MTKDDEIQTLRDFLSSLPTDSYLHPIITSILPAIEAGIRNDIIPDAGDELYKLWQSTREAETTLARLRNQEHDITERIKTLTRKEEIEFAELERVRDLIAELYHQTH